MCKLRIEWNGAKGDLEARLRDVADPTPGFFTFSGLGQQDLLMFNDQSRVRILLRPTYFRLGIPVEFHGNLTERGGRGILTGAFTIHPHWKIFARAYLGFAAFAGVVAASYSLIVPDSRTAAACLVGGIAVPAIAFGAIRFNYWLRRDSEAAILDRLRKALGEGAASFEVER